MPFDEASPPRVFWTACGTPHHDDCYGENGDCTVFGCKCAPADDPKLQVSQSDLSAVTVPVQQYVPLVQQYAPVAQQPAPVQGYQPSRYSGPLGLSQAAATAPAPIQSTQLTTLSPLQQSSAGYPAGVPGYGRSYKSRTSYIVLGIFLGALGIHNFYAGYTRRAVGQLCLSVLTLGYLAIASWIWAIVEICIVEKDGTGLRFS